MKNSSTDSDSYNIPAGPSDLCFDSNEFIKDSFSVDHFLQSQRNKANLETMRDDLGIYLKILRSSMIELINKDYADFVNLSSNLIGLDKAIGGIQVPLGQLKEEVLQVKVNLDEAISDLSSCLEQRRQLRMKKRSLHSLGQVLNSLKKLGKLLLLRDGDGQRSFNIDEGERAASEFNQLQFGISKCKDVLQPDHKQKVEQVSAVLGVGLDALLLAAVQGQDPEGLGRCLRVYTTLGRTAGAEEVVRREVVAPGLYDLLSDASLQSHSRGLRGVYEDVLLLLDTKLSVLLQLTTGPTPPVVGYSFLAHSVWPEVEQRLATHMASIYAPGNPDIFYQRYNETMNFLAQLERLCGTQSAVRHLRSMPQYSSFLQRWNLPVYFQIRFQEIGASLESVLVRGNATATAGAAEGFRLAPTATAWRCMRRCWNDGVFISQLAHRFWKLSLQILSRYSTWVGEALEQNWPSSGPVGEVGSDTSDPAKLHFLVCLHADIEALAGRLPELLTLAVERLDGLSEPVKGQLEASLEESRTSLISCLPTVAQFVLGEVSSQSLAQLRQVSDIPRLFRRTNRDCPTRPCAYVGAVLAPPLAFHHAQREVLRPELLLSWLTLIFSAITSQFYSSVDDVLTSVQKTEESLRRLKKIRDRSAAVSSSERGVGDDDKIRQQLALDVHSFCGGVESVGVRREDVERLEELVTLVESACSRSSWSSGTPA